MSFQDPPRRQRPSRYPALAQYEDGYSPYQEDQGQGYEGYQSYEGYQGYQSGQGYQGYQDTPAGYQGGNGYTDSYRGFAGMTGARQQQAPWDEPQQAPWDEWQRAQPTEWDVPRRTSGPFAAASEDDYDDEDAAPQDDGYGRSRRAADARQRSRSGLLAGGVAGFLAAAVALGVANLVAAFVRPQASPIIAVGGAFIDRTPSALKNFAVAKFGENDKNMLLLGMYVTIALIAIAIGVLAWRRLAIGVAGIGLFGLFGAFVAITRPESHVTDVIPSVVGGLAGIAAIVWLVRSGIPASRQHRTARTGGYR